MVCVSSGGRNRCERKLPAVQSTDLSSGILWKELFINAAVQFRSSQKGFLPSISVNVVVRFLLNVQPANVLDYASLLYSSTLLCASTRLIYSTLLPTLLYSSCRPSSPLHLPPHLLPTTPSSPSSTRPLHVLYTPSTPPSHLLSQSSPPPASSTPLHLLTSSSS